MADASHELRTPLTSIRGYAELLGRGGFSDEAGRQQGAQADRGGGDPDGRPGRGPPPAGRAGPGPAAAGGAGRPAAHLRRRGRATPTPWPTATSSRSSPGRRWWWWATASAWPRWRTTWCATRWPTRRRAPRSACRRAWRRPMGYIQVSDNGPGHPAGEAGRVFDRFYQGDPSRSARGDRAGPGHRAGHRRGAAAAAEVASTRRGAGARPWWSRSRWPPPHVAAHGQCRRRPGRRSAHRSCTEAPGTTASSTVASLTLVSAASASGSEPATMPAPARSVTLAPSACELRAADADHPLAVAGGADPADRARPSSPGRPPRGAAMKASASARGVPPTAGVGWRRSRSSSTPRRRRAERCPRSGCRGGPPSGRRPATGSAGTDELVADGRERGGDRPRPRSGAPPGSWPRPGQAALGVGVGAGRVAPRHGAGQGMAGDTVAVAGHQELGAGAEEGAVGHRHGEDGAVGLAGAQPAQHGGQGERAVEAHRDRPRQHDLAQRGAGPASWRRRRRATMAA